MIGNAADEQRFRANRGLSTVSGRTTDARHIGVPPGAGTAKQTTPASLGGRPAVEPRRELTADLDVSKEEGALVEAFPAQPTRDFVVALARIARAACRYDVGKGVPTATRHRQHAVALQRRGRLAAVRTAAPCLLQGRPLIGGEIVLDALHAPLASRRCPRPARPTRGHEPRVGARGECSADSVGVNTRGGGRHGDFRRRAVQAVMVAKVQGVDACESSLSRRPVVAALARRGHQVLASWWSLTALARAASSRSDMG